MSKTCREQVFPAEVDRLPEVLAFVEEQLEEAGCPIKTQMQISVAVEEIYVNIASYAYAPGTGTAYLRVECTDDPGEATILFVDSGVPFNPLDRPDPDLTLPAEEREIGGLGIYMTKKSMDELHYAYLDGQNRLTMVKAF